MCPGLNPQNMLSFRASLFRQISIIINLGVLLFDFVLSLEVNPKFDDCQPKNCGTGPNISYPFWILKVQQPYCGFPGFEIECNNRRPIYQTSRSSYVIEEIVYEENSFRVVNKAVLNAGCPLPSLNYSFDRLPVTFGPDQADLCIFRNCNGSFSVNSTISKAECDPGEGNNSFAAIASKCDYLNWNRASCEYLVAAPVQIRNWESNQSVEYLKLLEDGFMLSWIGDDCMRCRRSMGRCGQENSTSVCYCPDRTHFGHCGDGNKQAHLRIGLGSGIGALAIIFLCSCIYVRHKRRHSFLIFRSRHASSNSSLKEDLEVGNVCFEVPIFTNAELEEATNHFDAARELGDGGFGTVYYGKLRDGREVAVKRLYEHNYRRVKQFMTEVQILNRLRHKNLVSLYGCSSSRSRELLLVYEYILNGTVADHLHGERAKQEPLLWPTRISIAIETATALAYLHASDIIHRDVKTNNILLDKNFSVKVADFGLSRLFPNDVSHVSTAPQGTPGYVDPEYHQCYQLTEKSDVYSFGVVLVELVSSMPAVDISRDRHEINLANLATSKIRNRAFCELIDPNLGFESDPEINRMIMAVAELAFGCLQQDKDMRPSMKTVLEELKAISRGTHEPDKSKDVTDNNSAGQSKNPPPSPECEDAGLLKNMKSRTSPVSVTQKWGSSGSSSVHSG